MALLASPSPAPTMLPQSNGPTHTASLAETQLAQSAGGTSRTSTNGQFNGRPLYNLENRRPASHSSSGLENGLVNGDAEHVASSEPNGTSLKRQNTSRGRMEHHEAFAYRSRAALTRSKTNYEPGDISSSRDLSAEEHGELRHGWEDEYNSSEFLGQLNSVYFHMSFPKSTQPVG